MEKPSTKKQMQSFLGCINYHRRYVANWSEIIKPLQDAVVATSSRRKIAWNEQMDKAFDDIRNAISKDIKLAFPDFPSAEPLRLYVDASGYSVGACLTQVQQGELCIITHASNLLKSHQKNWACIDKELYAILFGIQTHRAYLLGQHFVV